MKFLLTTYPPLVHAVIECFLLHNGVKHFLVFLQLIFDEIFKYKPFPIGIMKFVRTVMVRIILLKIFHSIVGLSLTFTSTLDRLLTIFLYGLKRF